MEKIAEFHRLCHVIVREAKDGYAQTYARAGLTLQDGEACRVQALYILSNLATWRGDLARETKAKLKALKF